MDLIDLDEDTIDAEVLDALGDLGDLPLRSQHIEPIGTPRDHCRDAHRQVGRHRWSRQGQVGAPGDCPVPRRAPRQVHQVRYVTVEGCIVLWSSGYW